MNAKQEKRVMILGYLLLAATVIFFVFFLSRTIEGRIDSDDASELVLSSLLSREKKLISPNWYYSTELRVLNTNVVFASLFHVFSDWHMIRVAGAAILALILLSSVIYLFYQCGYQTMAPFAAMVFCIPFSQVYYEFVIERSYYIPHIATMFFTAGMLVAQFKRTKCSRIALDTAIGTVLSLAAGLGGPRVLILFYCPLMISVLWTVFNVDMPDRNCRIRVLIYTIFVVLGAAVGYLINQFVFPRYYHFDLFEALAFTTLDYDRFFWCVMDMLLCFGWQTGMVSYLTIIPNAQALILFSFSLYASARSMLKRTSHTALLSTLYLSSLFLLGCSYAFSNMTLSTRYSLPTAVIGFFVSLCYLYEVIREKGDIVGLGLNSGRRGIMAEIGLWVLVVACAGGLGYKELNRHLDVNAELRQVANFVKNQGYTYGYTSFWQGNVLTELTDGTVEMHVFCNDGTKDVQYVGEVFEWLQETDHAIRIPKGKVFLLLNNDQLAACRWRSALREEDLLYRSENYNIYGYENFETMKHQLYDSFQYAFADDQYCENGEVANQNRILWTSGCSYGPYVFLNQGIYQITIKGERLDQVDCYCTAGGEVAYDQRRIQLETREGKQALSFEITNQEDCYDFQIVITNNGLLDVTLENIDVKKQSEVEELQGEAGRFRETYFAHGCAGRCGCKIVIRG